MRTRTWQSSSPDSAIPVEIRWGLLRAFGPVEGPAPGSVDGTLAVDLAGDLGLVERIGARVPPSILTDELGREAARRLALERLQTLARVQGLCELIPELASLAESAGVPIVLLKFAAMHVGGYSVRGSRAAGDIDLLVSEGDAERLARILVDRGFLAADAPLADHHRLLHDREGRVVELHTCLPGVRVPGRRRFASVEALKKASGLEPAPSMGRGCHLLRRELMAAYAVAHGLAHHGGADVYPLTRALADVIDLLPGERRTTGAWAAGWVAEDVPHARLEAFLGLCDALEQGTLSDLAVRQIPGAEGALLDHVLRSSLDPDYRRSLAISSWFSPLSNQPAWWRILKRAQWAVFPTKAQLAVDLGVPGARPITGRMRLAHFVDRAQRLPRLARELLAHVRRRLTRRRSARSRQH